MLKRVSELVFVVVLFPIALALLITIAYAVSFLGLAAYVGALLCVWLLFAYVLPLATGVMTPDEIVAAFRARHRRQAHFEGEPLPEDRFMWMTFKNDGSD